MKTLKLNIDQLEKRTSFIGIFGCCFWGGGFSVLKIGDYWSLHSDFQSHSLRPAYKILVPASNINVEVSNGTRGLNFHLSLHLHPYLLEYASN